MRSPQIIDLLMFKLLSQIYRNCPSELEMILLCQYVWKLDLNTGLYLKIGFSKGLLRTERRLQVNLVNETFHVVDLE